MHLVESRSRRGTEALGAQEEVVDQPLLLDTKLAELGLDSIAGVELLLEIEEHFNINLPPLVLLVCRTVGEILGRVTEIINQENDLADPGERLLIQENDS